MAVLINDMEMPEKCGKCRFATAFECQVTKNFITTFNVRQVDCPLVSAADVRLAVKAIWKHVQWVVDEEWQDGGYWISRCSNCSMPYHTETPFCPHCGADMREES